MPEDPPPKPEYTNRHVIDGLFDPVIRRELDDHAAASGWLAPVDLRAIPPR